jgi:hypothetical protein
LFAIPGGIGDLVSGGNSAVRVDQVGDPLWVVGVLIVSISHYQVLLANRLVGVAQQREPEVVFLLECVVVRRVVERDAKDLAAGVVELLSLITQALSLKRSTGG